PTGSPTRPHSAPRHGRGPSMSAAPLRRVLSSGCFSSRYLPVMIEAMPARARLAEPLSGLVEDERPVRRDRRRVPAPLLVSPPAATFEHHRLAGRGAGLQVGDAAE